MQIKKIFKIFWILTFCLLFLLILIPFENSSNKLSNSKIEMQKIKTKFNQSSIIFIKGNNLNLNANNFLTSNTINNTLNMEPYELNFIKYNGYLQFNKIRKILINININGYKETLKKKMVLYGSSLGNINNEYVNKIVSLNNEIFAATNNGLYYSTDQFTFNKINISIINSLNISNIIVEDKSKLLYLINSDVLYVYSPQSGTVKMIFQGKLNTCTIFKNNLYLATPTGLYIAQINNLNNLHKISDENITKINYFNLDIYFISNGILYQITNNNFINVIFNQLPVISFTFSITGSVYFVTEHSLFFYDISTDELVNLKTINSSIFKNIFISYNDYIYLMLDNKVIKYKNDYQTIIQISSLLLNTDAIFQNFDNTLYCYSKINFTNIIFIQ